MSEKTTDEMEMVTMVARTMRERFETLSEAFADLFRVMKEAMSDFENIKKSLDHEIRANDAISQKRGR